MLSFQTNLQPRILLCKNIQNTLKRIEQKTPIDISKNCLSILVYSIWTCAPEMTSHY